MRAPSTLTILAFLAFAIEEVAAQDFKEQLRKLPVCAQSCISSAFAACKCKNLDFSCACTCTAFRPFSESCTSTSCAEPFLKTLLDEIGSPCKAESVVVSSSSSPSSPPTTTSPIRLTTSVEPTEPLYTADPTEAYSADITDFPGGPLYTPNPSEAYSAVPTEAVSVDPYFPGGGGVVETPISTDIYETLSPGYTPSPVTPSIFDETLGPGYTPSPVTPSIFDETRGPGFTLSATDLTPNPTTTSPQPPVYCSPGYNGTWGTATRVLNGTNSVFCTSYPVEEYLGGGVGAGQRRPWGKLGLCLMIGWLLV